jgi:PPM family protein phosphatase
MTTIRSFSEIGGGHATNEDAFAVEPHPSDPACMLCAVADGQGGQAGGGPAARLAVRDVIQAASREPVWRLAAPSTWQRILHLADVAVCDTPDAGFTTLIAFCVLRHRLYGASCGDSAVLVSDGLRVVEVTRDQRKNPPVGSSDATFAPFSAALSDPWAVLAASDGVWKYVGWEPISTILLSVRGQTVLDRLADAARLPRSGKFPDDFTAVLIEGGRY